MSITGGPGRGPVTDVASRAAQRLGSPGLPTWLTQFLLLMPLWAADPPPPLPFSSANMQRDTRSFAREMLSSRPWRV